MEYEMKAMLIRVGIDKGADGALGPIFEAGSFEFIPISEGDLASKEDRTYNNTTGRSGKPFAYYLPKRIANKTMHNDPEFETFTYGDPTVKRKFLLKLNENDLLIFYAGLKPFDNLKHKEALYIIGYFTVDKVIDFNNISEIAKKKYQEKYSNNAHLKRNYGYNNLVLIIGNPQRSELLEKAILLSKPKCSKNGRRYHAVSPKMEYLLGIKGSIQRSIPPRYISSDGGIHSLQKLLINNCITS